MKIQPHQALTRWAPDEIAECIDGVSEGLYLRLWALEPDLPELGETPDTMLNRAIINVWHKLSEEDQTEINRLIEDYETKFRKTYPIRF